MFYPMYSCLVAPMLIYFERMWRIDRNGAGQIREGPCLCRVMHMRGILPHSMFPSVHLMAWVCIEQALQSLKDISKLFRQVAPSLRIV